MASDPRTPSPGPDSIIAPSSGLAEVVDDGTRMVSALLRAGIPLSLLIDLAEPYGPDSATLYATEVRATD